MNSEEVISKIDKILSNLVDFWRRHPDLNRGIKALQASALPLGYGAIRMKKTHKVLCVFFGAEDGIRTRDVHLGKVTLYH